MRRDLLIAVAAGALGALLLVASWQGSILGATLGLMFSPLPLAMAVLGLGLPALPIAVASGAVTVAAVTGGSLALAVLYVASDALPVAIMTWIVGTARKSDEASAPIGGRTLGDAAAMLGIGGVVLMAAVLATLAAGPDGLEAGIRAHVDAMVADMPKTAQTGGLTPEALAEAMARILPGFAMWSWILRALVSVAIGQRLLARDGFARWPTPAYRTVAVPGWYIGVFWFATVAGWLMSGDAGYAVSNAALAMSLPLVLQGLAVAHVTIAKFGLGRMGVVVFYLMALVAAGASFALIAIIGVLEHFLQMRARMMSGPPRR